ncbi:putative S-adenosylmethionine-dependent methyltransferase-like [Capsicum annuum]|nr:putative S-adenosylmethionine-dependent methyltransferase-like [Capsicum annuum]KAF3678784.1 putative S-adenosylmethionine-dependent methyltransferase-like [Capsicum annuum]
MQFTRSVFFKHLYYCSLPSQSRFRLRRILDVCFSSCLYNSEAITELVHLRYLACPFDDGLVQPICNLWNLQVLVIHDGRPRGLFMTTLSIPWEVLNMPRLRYIHTKNLWLSIPPPISEITERENHLQTLTVLMPSSCTDEVFLRIANLKKLGILLVDDSVIAEKCYCLDNLVHLTQLEKFKVEIKEGYIFLRLCTRLDPSPTLHVPHCENFPTKPQQVNVVQHVPTMGRHDHSQKVT